MPTCHRGVRHCGRRRRDDAQICRDLLVAVAGDMQSPMVHSKRARMAVTKRAPRRTWFQSGREVHLDLGETVCGPHWALSLSIPNPRGCDGAEHMAGNGRMLHAGYDARGRSVTVSRKLETKRLSAALSLGARAIGHLLSECQPGNGRRHFAAC